MCKTQFEGKIRKNIAQRAGKFKFTAAKVSTERSPESRFVEGEMEKWTHCLLGKSGTEVEVVARVVDVGVAGVQRLVLLLLRHLLNREEPVLPHLDPLRHVTDARVFCNTKYQL